MSALVIGALFLAVVWWILTAGNWGSWIVGLPALAGAVWVRTCHCSEEGGCLKFRRLLGFVIFFFWHSLRGGIDVALRTFQGRPSLSYGLMRYRTWLPSGNVRVFFADIISLLPGTLTAERR